MAQKSIGGIHRVADRFIAHSRSARKSPPGKGGIGNTTRSARIGRVPRIILQFDDGHWTHHTIGWQILKRCGFVGSFGIQTNGVDVVPTAMTGPMLKEMVQGGCSLQDHTKDHNAAKWGDPGQIAAWQSDTDFSKAVFASLGMTVDKWNHPGGVGEHWTPELGAFLSVNGYKAVAGGVDLTGIQQANFHVGMLDSPMRCGRWTASWSFNAPAQGWTWQSEVEAMWTSFVKAWAHGIIPQPVFHQLDQLEANLGLTELCNRLLSAEVQVVTFDEAVRLMRLPHDQEYGMNIAPVMFKDLDQNGLMDGWESMVPITAQGATNNGAEVTIYGPLPGKLAISALFQESGSYTMQYTLHRIAADYSYSTQLIQVAHPGGTKFTDLLSIDIVDRVQIVIVAPGPFHILSFTAIPMR